MSDAPIPRAVELVATLLIPKKAEDFDALSKGITNSAGTITGPKLSGRVIRAFVTGKFNQRGRYTTTAEVSILTRDGAEILMNDRGEWRGDNGALVRLLANKFVSPTELYLVGVVRFQTSDPRYTWLKEGQFFSHAIGQVNRVKVSVYQASGQ
jgi:hypothetical protein